MAGATGQSGSVDGEFGVSRLSFPVSCTAAHGLVYFIEQGRVPAVKSFDGTTVKTIISGSPLKNLTDLCAGDGGSLLICDRGSSCIWKLQISDGEIFPLVTVSDICEVGETSLPFVPSGIVKVAEGSFLFSDLSRHQVFRYMSSGCAKEALESSRVSYCALEEAFSTSLQDIYRYIRNAQAVRRNILDGVALVWKMKEAILNYQVSSLPSPPSHPPPPRSVLPRVASIRPSTQPKIIISERWNLRLAQKRSKLRWGGSPSSKHFVDSRPLAETAGISLCLRARLRFLLSFDQHGARAASLDKYFFFLVADRRARSFL